MSANSFPSSSPCRNQIRTMCSTFKDSMFEAEDLTRIFYCACGLEEKYAVIGENVL